MRLTDSDARKALAVLVHEGRIAASEVRKALQNRDRLIRDLRKRLEELGDETVAAGRRFGKRAAAGLRAAEKASRPTRRRAKPVISAATRKIYQMQGRYMAVLRQLPRTARAKIKKIRASKGVKAAIAAAKKMARG